VSSSRCYQFYSCILKLYLLNLKNFFFQISNYQDFIFFKGLIPFHDTWSLWNSKEHGIVIIPALKDSLKRLPYKGSASSPGAKKQASFLVIQSTNTLLLLGINGICVIGHGGSKALSVLSALRVVHSAASHGVMDDLADLNKLDVLKVWWVLS